jgi:hypothetical protein
MAAVAKTKGGNISRAAANTANPYHQALIAEGYVYFSSQALVGIESGYMDAVQLLFDFLNSNPNTFSSAYNIGGTGDETQDLRRQLPISDALKIAAGKDHAARSAALLKVEATIVKALQMVDPTMSYDLNSGVVIESRRAPPSSPQNNQVAHVDFVNPVEMVGGNEANAEFTPPPLPLGVMLALEAEGDTVLSVWKKSHCLQSLDTEDGRVDFRARLYTLTGSTQIPRTIEKATQGGIFVFMGSTFHGGREQVQLVNRRLHWYGESTPAAVFKVNAAKSGSSSSSSRRPAKGSAANHSLPSGPGTQSSADGAKRKINEQSKYYLLSQRCSPELKSCLENWTNDACIDFENANFQRKYCVARESFGKDGKLLADQEHDKAVAFAQVLRSGKQAQGGGGAGSSGKRGRGGSGSEGESQKKKGGRR